MPSPVAHALAGLTLASALAPSRAWRRLAIVSAVAAMLPDVDAVTRLTGSHDVAFLGGHRGFTHSIAFAVLAGGVALVLPRARGSSRWLAFATIALATLSHGVLDAFSWFERGWGVALLSPFTDRRFLAPWQPVRGDLSEIAWCLVPLAILCIGIVQRRRLVEPDPMSPRPLGLQTIHDAARE